MKISYLFAVFTAAVSINSMADDSDIKVSCEYGVGYFDSFKTQHQSLQELAKVVGPKLCKNVLRIDDEEVSSFESALFEYSAFAKADIQHTFPKEVFSGIGGITDLWEEQLKNHKLSFGYLTEVTFKYEDKGQEAEPNQYSLTIYLPPHIENTLNWKIDGQQNKACKNSSSDMNCKKAIESISNAIKPAFSLLNTQLLKKKGKLLGQLQSDWEAFIKEARYQTPLDVWFTTTLQSNKFKGTDLTGPPNIQAFLLRPSFVYEYTNGLEKGNRDEVSFALEWVGFNWWKKGFGFSFTSVYNDRKEISAVGHGLAFHIKNKYSIGYVHRKDDKGSVFLNLDLLEIFGDKKDVYKKYKSIFKGG